MVAVATGQGHEMETSDQQPLPVTHGLDPLPRTPSLPSSPPSTTPPAGRPPEPRRSYWRWFLAATIVAAAVVAGALVSSSDDADGADSAAAPTTPTSIAPALATPTTTVTTAPPELTTVLLDASNVGARVIPSVVTVQISGVASGGGDTILGSGSGVVYDDQGHIVTNDHVVGAGSSYEIVLADGRVYPAELVGTDPTTDLAVLSVTAVDLRPISVGATAALTVGDPAVAVGSPLGLDGGPSLTVGVVSAFGREVQTDRTTILYGMLQTDAPITQGSSGGALVDGEGRLVGITTAVGVSDVGIEGIGFATPVEIVTRVANEIIADRSASNPYIGIRGATTFADTVDGGSIPIGVLIDTVEPGTAAATAGLATGDVIAAVNGDAVKTMDELIAFLRQYGAGATIEVSLDGGTILDITLGERPDDI